MTTPRDARPLPPHPDDPAPRCEAAITVVTTGQLACDGTHLAGTWHGASGETNGLRWRVTWEARKP